MTLRPSASLVLLPLLLASCGTVLPLPNGNAPLAPETSIGVEGRWVCTPDPAKCGSKFEFQVFGGGPLKLTLNNHVGAAADLRWVSSLGNVTGAGTTATVPYDTLNRALFNNTPVTFSVYDKDVLLAQRTLNIDDHAPEGTRGVYVVYQDADGRTVNRSVLNATQYLPAGVAFRTDYTDNSSANSLTRGSGVGMDNVLSSDPEHPAFNQVILSVYRNNLLQRENFRNTNELLEFEASGYQIKTAGIQDKLGNQTSPENLVIATINTDFGAPAVTNSPSSPLIVHTAVLNSQDPVQAVPRNAVITVADPTLEDGSVGSGVTDVQVDLLDSPSGTDLGTLNLNGRDGTVTITPANLAERGIPKGSYQVRVSATDAVGNTVTRQDYTLIYD
ncbi:hypothetical protein [Deinococcus ficus]|uniref:Bacterial Ig-like domain-containing protein n=1 Tax=Deinococcus ficus TaxID=317577 RepID=A0A221T2V0_9DEIO|nr:hypothetical protein [Deinococcus ficus]ASN83222.1 hypothetical protein DFI_18670 [Deinococcus ficus]